MMIELVKLKRSKLNMINNDKHVTTKELKRLTAENFTARSKQGNLATKADIDDFVKLTDFDKKNQQI